MLDREPESSDAVAQLGRILGFHIGGAWQRVGVAFVVWAVAFAVAADLATLCEFAGGAEILLLLIFAAALCSIVPCGLSVRVGVTATGLAVCHGAVLLVASAFDSRTFYGGAVMRVVPAMAWVAVTGLLLVSTLIGWVVRPRYVRGTCRACGYDLTGNVSGRCPECGSPLDRRNSGESTDSAEQTERDDDS